MLLTYREFKDQTSPTFVPTDSSSQTEPKSCCDQETSPPSVALMNPIRVLLSGFGDFGCQWARNILAYGDEIVGIVTSPPNQSDRWQESLGDFAITHDIALFGSFSMLLPEYDIVISASGRIYIPAEFIARAPLGGWNIHGALLPRLRGHCPINWSVIQGGPCGITLHALAKVIDAGGIATRQITTSEQSGSIIGQVSVSDQGTSFDVWRRCLDASSSLFHIYWPALRAGTVSLFPQEELIAPTKAPRRTPADGLIDWSWTSAKIHNFVRALAPPFPSAFCCVNNEWFKVYSGIPVPRDITATPGTEIAYKVIATGDAAYKISIFEPILCLDNCLPPVVKAELHNSI